MSQSTHSIISSDGKTSENKSLEVIKEELSIPLPSSAPMLTSKYTAEQCICKKTEDESSQVRISPVHVEEILRQKEKELREEYDKILQREKEQIKEKFNFILLNEQTRASYMLREAHRERQEKINALQTQLQCKNLAALMYVMCTERKRSRFEKLQIVEDYTNYINTLHDILVKGQELILHLSRGYKTAARVDHEWREKMMKVVSQFLAFIYHFAGGDPETNQYLIDLPKLLKTEAPLEIDPNEDPCDCDDDDDEDEKLDELAAKSLPHTVEKEWWQDLDSEEHPFVMYGDMADFQPNQRREVLKNIKAQKIRAKKTAPKEWKKLSFKDMFEHSKCVHLDKIKSMYKDRLPVPIKWECLHSPGNGDLRVNSKLSIPNTNRTASLDIRGTMGSILKIITSGPGTAPVPAKTELLGARDSIEITSMTRLSVKKAKSDTRKSDTGKSDTHHHPEANVTLNIGKKRASVFVENGDDVDSLLEIPKHVSVTTPSLSKTKNEDEINDGTVSLLGSLHTDSLTVIQSRHPAETDHLINYEKVCPMEKCQHMQVDAFMRSLPPYMTANPFTHFQQNFEEYETCTPEQLEMLKQRIENKMKKESAKEIKKEESGSGRESPLTEWFSTGVAVQTSDVDIMPPCICHKTPPKSPDPKDLVLNLAELDLVKLAMDAIHRECMFDDRIEFDRFKLIGKDTDSREPKHEHLPDEEFKESRYYEIADILKKHPSMLDIFQANAK